MYRSQCFPLIITGSRINMIDAWFKFITWPCFTYTPTLIIHNYGKWTSRWVIILYKLLFFFFHDYCQGRIEIQLLSLFPVVTPSKVYSDTEALFFCHKRLWCNIILKAPWMQRVALTAFICKSLWGSALLAYKKLETAVLHSLVCGGKHQICTNGKKKTHYWQHPRLIYALIRSKQRLRLRL